MNAELINRHGKTGYVITWVVVHHQALARHLSHLKDTAVLYAVKLASVAEMLL